MGCQSKFPEPVFERVSNDDHIIPLNKKKNQKKVNQSKGAQKNKNKNIAQNAKAANGSNPPNGAKKKRNRNKGRRDWKCTKCGTKNKKATNVCLCGHIRELTENEWICECTARNHVNLNKCSVCGTVRGW